MNKLTIPAILVATVMVAGIFAFMPVQQASTVHTTSTITVSSATIALVADEMLELREISVTDVDYNGAQSIRITGAAGTDLFQLLTLSIVPGTDGTPVIAADEINIDGVSVDGVDMDFTAIANQDILTGIEYISTLDIHPVTGNVIVLDMSDGAAPPADGETISFTATILIRNSASDPVITTS